MVRAFLLSFVLLLTVLAGPCAAQTAPTFLQATASGTDGSSFTFSAQDLGAAAGDRYIYVGVTGRKSGTTNCSVTSVTVQGITATSIIADPTNPTNCNVSAIYRVAVPTGTTGDIVVTMPATYLSVGIQVFRAMGVLSATAHATGSSSADDPTGTLTIPAHGFAIGVGMTTSAGATATWAGLAETHDAVQEGSSIHTSALLAPATRQTGLTVTIDFSASLESTGVWASWAPIGPVASTPTHYVTDSGSGSGICDSGTPCSLTRAFVLAGTGDMPPGSYVNVACGVYSQAALNPTTNSVQNFPIKFVGATTAKDCARLTGTRTALPAAGWSLTAGRTYTYQHAFDDVGLYVVGNVAQRPNTTVNGRLSVSTWVDIEVDDRQSPFTTPSGRIFSLVQPIRYTARNSIDEVEAQHCTFFHSGASNLLYIHPCREGAPSDADNYYAGSALWGTIEVEADDYWFQNFNFEQTTGQGLLLGNSAARFTGVNLSGMASQFWFQGTNYTLNGVDVSHVIEQGANDPNCFSSQYGGAGGRSCQNDGANGNQIIFGQEDTGFSYNGTVSNVSVSRGWNGILVNGPHTLDGVLAWGFANHAGFASGNDVTVRNYQCANAQDCWYMEGTSWDNHTYEHNLFYAATLWWASRDGAAQDIVAPTTWTFRYNIVANTNTDVRTQPTRIGDCNVWIPRNGTHTWYRVTPVDGVGTDPQYDTLSEIQAGTDDEDNSLSYAHTSWTDHSVFATFSSQQNALNFDLSTASPLTACGVRAGPSNLQFPFTPKRYRFRLPTP